MANAKRCDICGGYFAVPNPKDILCKTIAGRVMLHKLAVDIHHAASPEEFYFDACDECVQEIMDHILTKKSEWDGASK